MTTQQQYDKIKEYDDVVAAARAPLDRKSDEIETLRSEQTSPGRTPNWRETERPNEKNNKR